MPPRPSASSDILLSQLAGDGLVFRTHPQHAAPTFAIYKTSTKCRLILDLRACNKLFLRPPSFRLPTFFALLQSPSLPLYFVKLDVTNFFWSLSLPPTVSGYFRFQSSSASFTYGTRRLPFGWSFSSIISHLTLERILHPLLSWLPDTLWQYNDDILLAHPDPHFLSFVAAYATHLLRSDGLLISSKSVLVPSLHVTWLGKNITCHFLHNSPARIAQISLHLWLLRCHSFSFRSLQRLLGQLQWLCSPVSQCAPFLASAYGLLQTCEARPALLPRQIFRSLLYACISCLIPLRRCALPPAMSMPVFYYDAAQTPSGRFAVSCFQRDSFATYVHASRLG